VRLAAFALVALVAAPALATPPLKGNGQKTTTRRDVPPFSAIRLDGPVDATVRVGGGPAVSVTIDSNLQDVVRTRVEGKTLVVALERDASWDGKANVEISVPSLERFDLAGTGNATIEGGKGDLALGLAGAGDLRWRGDAAALSVAIQGAGNATLEGKAERLHVSVAGSGNVRAKALAARTAEVTLAGSGDVAVRLAGGTLTATVAGSGNVHWTGEGKVLRADVVGSGEVVHDG
jgi:hypothetical protein